MLHAVLVPARVPRGRLAELDCAEARAAAGVAAVLTAADLPRLTPPPVPSLAHSVIPMQDHRVHYEGQPIALVAAETRAQAQHAASLVRARYAAMAVAFGLPADHVHVSCPFVGGGFGCKGFVHPH
jgi:xanthine dehydrogenase YagR molybdenum-binding subunit